MLLKINWSTTVCFYPCDLFFINNLNMAAMIVEKHVLNRTLQVKIPFKAFF